MKCDHKSWSQRSRGPPKMGADTARVMENANFCRFHRKCDAFWISLTKMRFGGMSQQVRLTVGGSVSGPKWRIAILMDNKCLLIYCTSSDCFKWDHCHGGNKTELNDYLFECWPRRYISILDGLQCERDIVSTELPNHITTKTGMMRGHQEARRDITFTVIGWGSGRTDLVNH